MSSPLHQRAPDIDLGDDHLLFFHGWAPDRAINPQCDGIADVERFGATIDHRRPDNREWCAGGVRFDTPEVQAVLAVATFGGGKAVWQVESWDPLTLSPSILCSCGDHGFIRNGRWEKA